MGNFITSLCLFISFSGKIVVLIFDVWMFGCLRKLNLHRGYEIRDTPESRIITVEVYVKSYEKSK